MSAEQDLPQTEDEILEPDEPSVEPTETDVDSDLPDTIADATIEASEATLETREEEDAIEESVPKEEQPKQESTLPAFLRETSALVLIGAGLLLTIGLLIATAIMMDPTITSIPMTFDANGDVLTSGAPNDLYNLATVGLLAWLIATPLGAWLHWRRNAKFLAYVLWLGTVMIAILLWGAVARALF